MELRRRENGSMVPRIYQTWIETVGPDFTHETRVWLLEHPEKWEWDCCGLTEIVWFRTWIEAVQEAGRRQYGRDLR